VLVADGMRLDRAFLTISSCSPSRSSILTGRYPHSTGAEDLHQPLAAGQKTIAPYLRKPSITIRAPQMNADRRRETNDLSASICVHLRLCRDGDSHPILLAL
jgi:hypothetical protein